MSQATSHRTFEPGTAGWTVDDLYDPDILWQWSEGRYEIVEGVLTMMAPQGFEGVDPLTNLQKIVERHFEATGHPGTFYREVDLLLRRNRIPRPDSIFLTRAQRQEQLRLQRQRPLPPGRRYHPVYVMPPLAIESVSVGHEKHDRVVKRKWYAEAGIQQYWILTAHERSLVCLVLKGKEYVVESSGEGDDAVASSIFGGVTIPLAQVWDDVQ